MRLPLSQDFFDVAGPYRDLFRKDQLVWEAIRDLPSYVDQLFTQDRAKRISLLRRIIYRLHGIYVGRRVSIGSGTVIYPGAYIADEVIIGRNCRIGQHATLKGPLILSDDCVVGPTGEVGKSFFFPGARAAHKNFVGESIIGRSVNLGAGAETANWKLDGSEISTWISWWKGGIEAERVNTGLNHFGAVVGDGSSIGGNSVFQPGALLGKNCRVGPLVVVPNRYHPDGTVLKGG